MTTTPIVETDAGGGSARPPGARRRLHLLWPWLALLTVVAVSLAFIAARSTPDDSVAARVRRLTHELKCPTCQGLSVADSHDPSSEAMRTDVRERMQAGQGEEEIRAAYVEIYGETILLKPEGHGLGVLVWGLPVAVLVAGGGGILFALRRGREREGAAPLAGGRRLLAVGAVVAVAAASGVLLAVAVGDRTPGGAAADPAVPSRSERRVALASAVERHPDDYDARIAYARFLVNDDESYRLEAVKQFDAAVELDPSQPEPSAYAGWLIALSAGEVANGEERALLLDGAHQRLERAIALDDRYPDAYVFKGLLLFEIEEDAESAIPYFQRYLQLTPDDDPMREVVLGALAQAVNLSPTTTVDGPAATTAPAGAPSATTTAVPLGAG